MTMTEMDQGQTVEIPRHEEGNAGYRAKLLENDPLVTQRAIELKNPAAFEVSGDKKALADEMETDVSVFKNMRIRFSLGPHPAFAYLLFIQLYVPCFAGWVRLSGSWIASMAVY